MTTEKNGGLLVFPQVRSKTLGRGPVPAGGAMEVTPFAKPEKGVRTGAHLGPLNGPKAEPNSYSVGPDSIGSFGRATHTGMGYTMPCTTMEPTKATTLTVVPDGINGPHENAVLNAGAPQVALPYHTKAAAPALGPPPLVALLAPPVTAPPPLEEVLTKIHREDVTTGDWPPFMKDSPTTAFVARFREGRWLTFLETSSLGAPRSLRFVLISSAIVALDLARHSSTESKEAITEVIDQLMQLRERRY